MGVRRKVGGEDMGTGLWSGEGSGFGCVGWVQSEVPCKGVCAVLCNAVYHQGVAIHLVNLADRGYMLHRDVLYRVMPGGHRFAMLKL